MSKGRNPKRDSNAILFGDQPRRVQVPEWRRPIDDQGETIYRVQGPLENEDISDPKLDRWLWSERTTLDLSGERIAEPISYECFSSRPQPTVDTAIASGSLHRLGGPAIVATWPDGTIDVEVWLRDGRFHREGGPALLSYDSFGGPPYAQEWFDHGQLHREDGPAVIHRGRIRFKPLSSNLLLVASTAWFLNGKLHREGAPAASGARVTCNNSVDLWAEHGKLHRTDGPAVEHNLDNWEAGLAVMALPDDQWWWRGKRLSEDEWRQRVAEDAAR
jgi:hypothetical protein